MVKGSQRTSVHSAGAGGGNDATLEIGSASYLLNNGLRESLTHLGDGSRVVDRDGEQFSFLSKSSALTRYRTYGRGEEGRGSGVVCA